jgi:phage/plasmid primase-like uncharacterized protein
VTIDAVEIARHVPIERVIAERGIALRGRVERVGACPKCGGDDRFAINTKKQLFNCRGCGRGGDVIALVRFLDGVNFVQAVAALARVSTGAGDHFTHGRGGLKPAEDSSDYERRQRNKARSMWRASRAAAGTVVETYLRMRGITIPLPATVRFLPPLRPDRFPAMILPYDIPNECEPGILAAVAEAKITAVHLVLLKPDGTDKADIAKPKITVGSPAGMPMVLAPMGDLLGLAICEGAENALSIYQMTGLGSWAAGPASFLPALADAASYADCVSIFADDDSPGERYSGELAARLTTRGFRVVVVRAK